MTERDVQVVLELLLTAEFAVKLALVLHSFASVVPRDG